MLAASLAAALPSVPARADAPPEIPRRGLELWLKADGVMQTEGATVTQWNDASSRANDAVRDSGHGGNPANPTLVRDAANARPVLRFDGSDVWFSFRRIPDMRTIFWVLSKAPAAFGTRAERIVFGDTGSSLRYHADFHPGAHAKSFILDGIESTAFLREGQTRLNGRLVDGTATEFPASLGVISLVATAHVGASRLGYDRGYADRGWQGDIAEVIVYNRVLSDAERAQVEDYLFAKYGIAGQSEPSPPSAAWAAAVRSGATPPPRSGSPRPIVIAALAWLPDGKSIVAASDRVRVWDPDTGQLIRALPGAPGPETHRHGPTQPGQFTGIAYRSDGGMIAACATDLKLRLWDGTGNPIEATGDLKASAASWDLAFSPDGTSLLLDNRGKESEVRRYNLATGALMAPLTPPAKGWGARVWWMGYDRDGALAAASGETGSVCVWDTATGSLLASLDTGSIAGSCAFSPDGRTLAAACANMTMQLWDVATGKLRLTLSGHAGALNAVTFSSNGRMIATAGDDSTICLWDAWTGQFVKKLDANQGGVWCLAFSPDDKTLASGGQDLTIQLWDLRNGSLRRTIETYVGD